MLANQYKQRLHMAMCDCYVINFINNNIRNTEIAILMPTTQSLLAVAAS